MLQRTAFVLIAILLNLRMAFAGDETEAGSNDFGLAIGPAGYQVKENVLNKIRHKGTFISGGLFYERSRAFSKQRFEFYAIFSKLESRYDPDKASIVINPSMDYRYARKIEDISQHVALFAGGVAGFDSHIAYYENWDESHFYWLTSYYLGFAGVLTYRQSETGSLYLEVDIPVVALISRPLARILRKEVNPEFSWIAGKLHEDLTLTSIHQHFALNMDLGYTFRYSDRFRQSIFWRSRYTKNSMAYSRDIAILTHTLGVTFLF